MTSQQVGWTDVHKPYCQFGKFHFLKHFLNVFLNSLQFTLGVSIEHVFHMTSAFDCFCPLTFQKLYLLDVFKNLTTDIIIVNFQVLINKLK